MAWWELNAGGYVNGERIDAVTVAGADPTWRVVAAIGGASFTLKGDHATQSAALTAARKLCQGFDTSVFV